MTVMKTTAAAMDDWTISSWKNVRFDCGDSMPMESLNTTNHNKVFAAENTNSQYQTHQRTTEPWPPFVNGLAIVEYSFCSWLDQFFCSNGSSTVVKVSAFLLDVCDVMDQSMWQSGADDLATACKYSRNFLGHHSLVSCMRTLNMADNLNDARFQFCDIIDGDSTSESWHACDPCSFSPLSATSSGTTVLQYTVLSTPSGTSTPITRPEETGDWKRPEVECEDYTANIL